MKRQKLRATKRRYPVQCGIYEVRTILKGFRTLNKVRYACGKINRERAL